MSSRTATFAGFGAIALWSLLALFTVLTGAVPPFQLAAMAFVVGGSLGALSWRTRAHAVGVLRQPAAVWALGVGGLFGYHALYFASLRIAPPAEAGLVNYLWPLLIVLFSAFLPGERLRAVHVIGALLGFCGVITLMAGRGELELRAEHGLGYGFALAGAFVWSGYSVLCRRFGSVPTDAVAAFCLAAAALSLVAHVVFERTVWPAAPAQWLSVLALGIGPLGAAFYLWDVGVKFGDIRLLGIASYAAPVLSTLLLVVAGFAEPTLALAMACALIVTGALIATLADRRATAQPDACSDTHR
jgi:drug/metabolite transporter (DMT)-like permease